MPNQQLLDYIKQQLEQGIDREQIRQTLLNNGWQNVDIESAFSEISGIKPPKAERKWKKVLLTTIIGLVAAVVVIFFSFPYILNLFAKDIPPIDDSDLQLQKVYVPENENAYYDLIKLKDVVYEPTDRFQTISDMIKGKTWDEALARELISKNAKTFEYFSQAAQKPRFQDPIFSDPLKVSFSSFAEGDTSYPASTRQAARITTIYAMELAKESKSKEAINKALEVVKVGQKIENSQVDFALYTTVGRSLKSSGLETLSKIISQSNLKTPELKQLILELNQFYSKRDDLITTIKMEYTQTNNELKTEFDKMLKDLAAEKGIDYQKLKEKSYYFEPNKTQLLFAEYARQNIENARKDCSQIRTIQSKKHIVPDTKNWIKAIRFAFQENSVGKLIYDLTTLDLSQLFINRCLDDFQVPAIQTLIAIKAYKNDTGNYPASLNDLVPNYLASLPKDPFDGKPLKYSALKKIIYSVGPDGQDSGGSSGDNLREMPDPTLQIEF